MGAAVIELVRTALLLAALHGGSPEPRPVVQLAVQPTVRAATQARTDAWLGSDKFRHFAMSYATSAFTFAAVSAAGTDHDAALTVAVSAGAAAGVGKELFDRNAGGPFSLKDLVADALGVAAAYFVLREVH